MKDVKLPSEDFILKAVLLTNIFPDVFAGVKEVLLEEYPYLVLPCLREVLMQKTVFYIIHAVASSKECDWDVKIEKGLEVSTCISFEETQDPTEGEWFEDVRNYTNHSYIQKMIHGDAVRYFAHRATLHRPK